jgi:anti-sigma factor RsiW
MNQTNELHTLLLDYLDDLLDATGRARVEEMLTGNPDVAETMSRLRLLRGELFKAQPVEPPSDELRERVMAAARNQNNAERSGARGNLVFIRRATRYAAGFAAGVLTTLALSQEPEAGAEETTAPRVETASRDLNTAVQPTASFRRRIR